MKKTWKKVTAISAAAMLAISFTACNAGGNGDSSGSGGSAGAAYSYLAIDINPSVELVLKDGVVESVNAVNDDAAALISGEDFVGDTAEEATETIVELAEQMGYLTDENNDVKITVAADSEEEATEMEQEAKRGAEKGSDKAKVNHKPRNSDDRLCEKLKGEDAQKFGGLTPAKIRLIEAIMRYDETMTYELGATMKFSELADMLEDYVEEYKDLVGDEMKKDFKEKVEALKAEKEAEIAAIYGEEYLAAWTKYNALETAIEAIEDKAENASLSDDDIAAIMNLLGLDETQKDALANKDGVINVESVDRYLDKHLDDDFAKSEAEEEEMEDLEDSIEDILEKYDEDDYVLTSEDLTAIATAWGVTADELTFTDLDGAEEFLDDAEEALEDLRESIPLTADQQAQIQAILRDMKDVKDTARDELKNKIDEMKQHFHDFKQGKLEEHGFGDKGGMH